jgi:oligopeptidase B
LFIQGGSAGGLLVGAVVNMRPDLFKGVIAQVPFVDVVTTMLDETIPLTTGEYDEWGNPNDKEYYEYMLSYSPYDNVEPKEYPNMLVTTGPPRFTGAVLGTGEVGGEAPVNEEGQQPPPVQDKHGSRPWRRLGSVQEVQETALEYAFILQLLGISL